MLKNKNIIVSGASKGIGKSMLKVFAENGANLIPLIRTKSDAIDEYIKSLSDEYNIFIEPYYFDLTDFEEMKNFFAYLKNSKIKIDGLVNNAGIMNGSLFQMTSLDKFRQEMEINMYSVFQLTQYISKIMQRQKSGSIVNISSVLALDGYIGKTSYSASKGAIISFTKSLSREVGAFNIRVNCIAPGIVDTELLANTSKKEIEDTINKTDLKRIAKAEDIANTAMFLLSDYSSYITGETIRVDGGM